MDIQLNPELSLVMTTIYGETFPLTVNGKETVAQRSTQCSATAPMGGAFQGLGAGTPVEPTLASTPFLPRPTTTS